MADNETIITLLREKFSDKIEPLELNPPQAAVRIAPEIVGEFFSFIKDAPQLDLNYLCTISGVDTGEAIDIVYFISSIEHKHKLTVRTTVARVGGRIDSIQHIIKAANWFEREIWELFGVEFVGHPDLTRFLLPDDWDQGHPMLRDWEGPELIKMPEVQ